MFKYMTSFISYIFLFLLIYQILFYNILSHFSLYMKNTIHTEAYLLSHNGLGDNITLISAINCLLMFYDRVHFLCKNIYHQNVELLINNNRVNVISFDHANEMRECIQIIKGVDKHHDVFISGCHKGYLKSCIRNINFINFIRPIDKNICKYNHITQFYNDIMLNDTIYFNYFNILNSEKSELYYSKIQQYKIIFLHTKASNRKINFNEVINKYLNDENTIIICANENIYENTHSKYLLADEFVNIYIQYYINIIKNATEIYIIDSCFSCIVYPLHITKKLMATNVVINER
jgi:hypothetical protein